MGYDHKRYETRCFQERAVEGHNTLMQLGQCGGVVEYWWFDSDDSYSPGGGGIACKLCKYEYSHKEWGDRT